MQVSGDDQRNDTAAVVDMHDVAGADADHRVGPDACSIAASLEIVGDRWTILILRDAFRGLRRFDEFRRDLDIPRAVLAERLRRLVDHGVMVKRAYQERPVRYEYRLTKMGIELSPILVALMQWGDRWLSEDGAPTLLVHEPCGTEVDLGFYCWTCKLSYSPTEIASRPGAIDQRAEDPRDLGHDDHEHQPSEPARSPSERSPSELPAHELTNDGAKSPTKERPA